jgi:hypothetical protein
MQVCLGADKFGMGRLPAPRRCQIQVMRWSVEAMPRCCRCVVVQAQTIPEARFTG